MLHLKYTENNKMVVGRMIILMEDKEDESLTVECEKKVLGQGICETFSQRDFDKITFKK